MPQQIVAAETLHIAVTFATVAVLITFAPLSNYEIRIVKVPFHLPLHQVVCRATLA